MLEVIRLEGRLFGNSDFTQVIGSPNCEVIWEYLYISEHGSVGCVMPSEPILDLFLTEIDTSVNVLSSYGNRKKLKKMHAFYGYH